MSEGDWAWELTQKAQDDLAALDSHEQQRILDKPAEIVGSPWRDPPDYGEPLQNHRQERGTMVRTEDQFSSESNTNVELSGVRAR